MNNKEIVSKLWKLCDVLRDDGITYHQYVTELTYILFLKMSKETGTEDKNPEKFYMEYVTPLDVDLTSLEHYPSIEISKNDLQ